MELLYLDRVKILSGFYKGLEGTVTDIGRTFTEIGKYENRYYVTMIAVKDNGMYNPKAWIPEEVLELIQRGELQ